MKDDVTNYSRFQQRGGNLKLRPNVLPHKKLNLDLHLNVCAGTFQQKGILRV